MFIAGSWVDGTEKTPLLSPYSGEQIDEVPAAGKGDVERALEAAAAGARVMAQLPAHRRSAILCKAADLCEENVEDLAQTVSLEEGKPIVEARGEASRLADLLRLAAFEGTQVRGETLPVDSQAGVSGKLGMTLRVPCGVVLAITPFNYPLLLVAHKLGPALATGNAVILKPASQTPLSAVKFTQLLLAAGLPETALQCITGFGGNIGPALCADSRVRKISFTGSAEIGLEITRVAGVKKLSMELGSNCPLVVLPDADLKAVAQAVTIGGYTNAGQVCISTQRVLVQQNVYTDFLDLTKKEVEAITVGNPLHEETKLSAMISEREAKRVQTWVDRAVQDGARLITGGERDGAIYSPTIVADVDPAMRVSCDEIFGPALAVTPVMSVDEAIKLANDSRYGLGAGVFTRNVNHALRFARELHTGNVMINWTPLWRADLQPYGGFKQSGFGKEGPRYAVEEMTEIKTVVFHDLEI